MSESLKEFDVNMEHYRETGAKAFSGRQSGRMVRTKLNLAALEKEYAIINIRFPEDTHSVNSSFFLGLFGESVRELGEAEFVCKYKFKYIKPIIKKNIDQGIFDALNE